MLCLEGLIIWLGLGVVPNLALLFWVLVLAEPVGEDGVDEVRERLWSRGGSGSVLVGCVQVEVIWGLVPDQLLLLGGLGFFSSLSTFGTKWLFQAGSRLFLMAF